LKTLCKIFLFATLVFVSGCKPRVSLSGATIPVEAKTISVGFFTNNTTLGSPNLSQRFTERLRDMVSQQTSLALVRQNGDLQFEGFLYEYNIAPVAVQGTDQASSNRLTITVSVKYTNRFDKTKSFEQYFTRFADFASTESINARETDLTNEIFRQLTEDIFNKAFNNW
jgi:hypothetical protein